ncbi:hypothetical protein OPT61_g2610 [Boeremia exigua]|uniref:Uncharacterized protein n=1 Tax=Boeremia exigua TaxID=749465 RepID=A0ACC2IKW9_9PLEO|nr:hypothetical protein OPT61_g2610 [Boeremia exigua]
MASTRRRGLPLSPAASTHEPYHCYVESTLYMAPPPSSLCREHSLHSAAHFDLQLATQLHNVETFKIAMFEAAGAPTSTTAASLSRCRSWAPGPSKTFLVPGCITLRHPQRRLWAFGTLKLQISSEDHNGQSLVLTKTEDSGHLGFAIRDSVLLLVQNFKTLCKDDELDEALIKGKSHRTPILEAASAH